ncbi:MAG: type II secretion system secretin GspD [Myxococcales bacterium]|nr:type II secretion system secretin GspD [Myxococcales bacterium]MCB9522132.1 type II secretion system secretin GspD [Myxococcales bacterium]
MRTLTRTLLAAPLGLACVCLFLAPVNAWAQDDPEEPALPKLNVGQGKLPRTLKGGALPGPRKVPLDVSQPLAQRRPNLDKLKKFKAKGNTVKREAKPAPDATTTGAGAMDTKGPPSRRPPPGGEDKTAEKKVPAWQQVKENEDDGKPTLSADFVKRCARLQPGVKVHLDIYDEELDAVVKLIACMTGKNIILAKPLKGKKITIYSPTLVTANEAYRAFLTALEANSLTISKQGKFLRIVDIKDFPKKSDPFLPAESTPPQEDRMVTQIVSLGNVDAQEINEVISKLASPNAQIIVYQPTNSLIMTELSSNLRKLKGLIKELDVPGGQEQLWTYQILHADAQEIAQKIQEVFEDGGKTSSASAASSSSRRRTTNTKKRKGKDEAASSASVGESDLDAKVSKIVADERTNRLFLVATARSYRRVKSLIAKLDVPIPGDGQVHIHQLNHAKAADLASVLSNLSQEQRSRTGNSSSSRTRRAGTATTSSKSAAKGAAATGATSAALFEGEVSVTADEDTNALVVTASLKDYLSLKKVIEILDKPRRQVFIEAIVMEVSVRNERRFGVSFNGGLKEIANVSGESVPLLFSNQVGGVSSFNLASAATLTGLAVATQAGETFDVGGFSLPAFGVILRALATTNDVNIMSTPHLLTTDNEEAEIVVGSNVPFIAGIAGGGLGGLSGLAGAAGATGAAGLGGFGSFFPTVNVQRQDVALTLKITPRINAANYVTMEVDQVIEEIEGLDPQLGPTTSKRSIKSTVVVGDQQTVVIGGLQKTRMLNNKNAVPWLGEIPIIGYLFRDTLRERERRNLLLLLTPHVIEGPEDFKAIFERKLEEHREFVARFKKDGSELTLGLDFGKKHGALEAIHKAVEKAREEERVMQELRNQEKGPPLPQEIDGIEMEIAGPDPEGDEPGAAPVEAAPEAAVAPEDAPTPAEDAQ